MLLGLKRMRSSGIIYSQSEYQCFLNLAIFQVLWLKRSFLLGKLFEYFNLKRQMKKIEFQCKNSRHFLQLFQSFKIYESLINSFSSKLSMQQEIVQQRNYGTQQLKRQIYSITYLCSKTIFSWQKGSFTFFSLKKLETSQLFRQLQKLKWNSILDRLPKQQLDLDLKTICPFKSSNFA